MLNPRAFLLSIGVHTALLALLLGALSLIHKKVPPIEEKISLKILLQPTASEQIPPLQTLAVPPKAPITIQKNTQPKVITPPKIQPTVETATPAPAPKVITQTPQLTTPVISKAPISEPSVVKTPMVQPKELPPKHQKEEYVYAHASKVKEILNQRKIFPKMASKLKQYGEVTIVFDFTPNGEANNIRILKSSGYDSLDDAAKELIKSSVSLFPKPLETVPITLPIEYMR